MSQMNITQIEKFQILPSNNPASGKYSFRAGNPIITFNIGSTNKLLKASSVRINGKLRILNGGNTLANNGALKVGGVNSVRMNSRVGINSIFQNINIASNDTNQTLESIRQYGRLTATVLPSVHSQEDFINNNAVVELNPALDDVCGAMTNNEVSFSCRLYSGMLNSGNVIPMGVNGVRGLSISLELVSDQQFLSGADAAANAGANYEVRDLSLTGNFLIPDAQGQQQLSVPSNGSFSYNSFNNLYSVIDSNDATQTYNLAQDNVLSVFSNFLPVSQSNSYDSDGFRTEQPLLTDAAGNNYEDPDAEQNGTFPARAVINKVSFSRGGMKLALDYDLDVKEQSQQNRPQTGVQINALNAIQPYYLITKTVDQPLLFSYGGNDEVIYQTSGLQALKAVEPNRRNFAVGVAMDNVSQVGISFRGQSYATRIQSNLDGKSPNSVFTYVLSKNTLVYSPQGIVVQN